MRGVEAAPRLAHWIGLAGLSPQIAAVFAVASPNLEWHFAALCLGYAYAALILSFLGGLWWGLAAMSSRPAPRWIWFVAVAPTVVALLSAFPWALGEPWPRPSLILLGSAITGSVAIDIKLQAEGMCPPWWLGLRVPLSIGLGGCTLALAGLA